MSGMNRINTQHHGSKSSRTDSNKPAIMESISGLSVYTNDDTLSLDNSSFQSNLSLYGVSSWANEDSKLEKSNSQHSFVLMDDNEYLKVSNSEQFIQRLHCNRDQKVKVISIFGNTGDGKSHTLNHALFDGCEVFQTSSEQKSCTIGVHAAYDSKRNVICLDTEGLLGMTTNENVRTRFLLKVLAISDIVIYRTRSERLTSSLFMFLGSASRVYTRYFQAALQAVGQRDGVLSSVSTLGPCVIIFHETQHTVPLKSNSFESPEERIRRHFADSKLEIEAFSSIKYVGIHTKNSATDFEPVKLALEDELKNTTVRSARKPDLVFETLKILNDKFSGDIKNIPSITFPDQYFTCPAKCFSCDSRCQVSMGHVREGKPHASDARCRYEHQYENLVYTCKACHNNGKEVVVTSRVQTQNDSAWYSLAKYAWSGYVIECPHCGEIYRSRQHWYGNKNPEDAAVRTEITHVWTLPPSVSSTSNTAQRVLDSVSYITEAVSTVSLQPTKTVTAWVADQVAPTYWRPNHEIHNCYKCNKVFTPIDTKHHCRACGEGFCASCSSNSKCVPSRNWHTPVRVCDACYAKDDDLENFVAETETNENDSYISDVSARKVSEQVVSTLTAVGTVVNYSKTIIKDSARPLYWVPDAEITDCHVCKKEFSDILPLHHCRSCGNGVCHDCSQNRKPVPSRGWNHPVRVCNSCMKVD
ncbi:hypothetical protein QAD02_019868 [Eretmocerus hayati]|uniref:Uncharacterized protein n=1 Tax=Eretmocerus hayati TaxID=131215 RepID=A0ACC2PM04_9HYME|nr:hypothetical protein QAD02_019868 [Eretmocerus hayati]